MQGAKFAHRNNRGYTYKCKGGSSMQMEIEAAEDRLTARIKGELDHHSAAQARAQLDALIADKRIRELRLDLKGLTFMDSSGLGVILGRYRVIAGRGGKMSIGGANRSIERILRRAGIYALVDRMDI